MTTRRPRIALTLGDPTGIGPELAAKLLARPETTAQADVYVLADAAELAAAAQVAGVEVPLAETPSNGYATLLDDDSLPSELIPAQQVSVEAGARAIHQLTRALSMAKAGEIDAIVFTPLNKTSLKLAGMNHEDELRWFAHELGYDGVTSELNGLDELTTARVTSHIPLSEVAANITAPRVTAAISVSISHISPQPRWPLGYPWALTILFARAAAPYLFSTGRGCISGSAFCPRVFAPPAAAAATGRRRRRARAA